MNTVAKTDIRKKARKGIDRADDTTVKMILAMLEVQEQEAEEETKEILRRFDDYEQGRIVPLTHEEFETGIQKFRLKKDKKFVKNG